MNDRHLLLAVVVAVPFSTLAQDGRDSSCSVSSVYLAGGGWFTNDQPLFPADLHRLAPGSALLASDLADHRFYSDPFAVGSGAFEMGIGLHPFRSAARSGPELRLGFLYGGRDYRSASYSRRITTPWDTLTSSQTGEQYIIDSVHRSTYWIDHSAERFGLNASLVWRTRGRWSVYGGFGLAGGISLNARTELSYSEYSRLEGQYANQYGDPFNDYPSTMPRETFRNGTGWWLATSAPFGLDFRMARRSEFWRRMHLYMEWSPQLLIQSSPELGTRTGFGMRTAFGLRFEVR